MPGGRPAKLIDWAVVEALAAVFCTQEEIAEQVGVTVRTLQRKAEFRRRYKKGLEKAKANLRRMQFKSAASGNVTMQIWLGKQYLNQSDRSQTEIQEDKDNVGVLARTVKDFLDSKADQANERNRSDVHEQVEISPS
jgi:hypothetical protein